MTQQNQNIEYIDYLPEGCPFKCVTFIKDKRIYVLTFVEFDLVCDPTVMISWGPLGSQLSKSRVQAFKDTREARQFFNQQYRRRISRGYHVYRILP